MVGIASVIVLKLHSVPLTSIHIYIHTHLQCYIRCIHIDIRKVNKYKKHVLRLGRDGGEEGHVPITSSESTRVATSCWTTITRRSLEPPKKMPPHPNAKAGLYEEMGGGTITMKSNPMPAVSVTHKLENSNTKEGLPLL